MPESAEYCYYPASLFDALVRHVPSTGLAIDCATGTGQAVPALAARFDTVFAFDKAAKYLRQAPQYPHVRYHLADAGDIAADSGSVDLVCAAQALHQFDIPAFFREVTRVLKPGGILACWCFGRYRIDAGIEAHLADFERDIAPHWEPEHALVSTGYRDIDPPFPVIDIGRHYAKANWGRREFSGYLHSWSATRRFREFWRTDPVPEIPPKLWGGHYRKRPVKWPLHILSARKTS